MKNPVRAEYKKIQAKHAKALAFSDKNDHEAYNKIYNAIQTELRAFIFGQDFINLSKREILQLVHLAYKYNAVQIHTLGIYFEKQYNLSDPNA